MSEQLLTLPRAADRLGISRSTLEREIKDGKIAICRIRGRVLIAEPDINAYIARLRTYVKKSEVFSANQAPLAIQDFKFKTGALRSLLENERRGRTRFK
jgi:excisionase family DNA binding protein